jgi:hypothetical protein
VLAVAAVALPGTAAAKKRRRTCTPSHSTTVVANARVRVYRRKAKSGDVFLYACAHKTRRRVKLPSNEPGVDGYGPFALSGRYLAFGYYPSCGVCEDEDNFVWVMDAVRRRERHVLLDDDDDGKATRITDLEVDPRGSVAWISRDLIAPSVLVQKSEHGSSMATMLDSGPDVARHSLARSGRTLYWTKAGVPKSAQLGG